MIDHIVPLAAGVELGGVHAPWNVQCAHFLCNSIKRDQFAQAALF
ncbi:HNH endonuclease [Parafrankia discariae]|nr:HNH endonuclease [Parafrankia discariae]